MHKQDRTQSASHLVPDAPREKLERLTKSDATFSDLVAYGGIAIRTLQIAKTGQYHQGHRHNYDHITNLIQGSVLCEVDTMEPKVFTAPCQITIAADHWHKFTALTDDVVYQCIFRQPDRVDLFSPSNSPYELAPFTAEELTQKLKAFDNPCSHCDGCKTMQSQKS